MSLIRAEAREGQCVHFEVCKSPVQWREGGTATFYCILHLPAGTEKEHYYQNFVTALKTLRAEGGCDFRWIVAPNQVRATPFERQRFKDTVDFRSAVFHTINLEGATLDAGLIIESSPVVNVHLERATIAGPVTIKTAALTMLNLTNATVASDVETATSSGLTVSANHVSLSGGIELRAHSLALHMQHATVRDRFAVRGIVEGQNLHLTGTTFDGPLDLSNCQITGSLQYSDVVFTQGASLVLAGSRIGEDLIVEAGRQLPREIVVNGTHVSGRTRVTAALGATAPRLVATDTPPRFRSGAEFGNVNLSRCLLLGNDIASMRLDNITWCRAWRRFVLYDGIALRDGRATPLGNLREAYQSLKERYRTLGDHVRSGDFHYGEMETKRREFGRWRQFFSLEFVYCLLSGYGTRYPRALVGLLVLVVMCAAGFWWLAPAAFGGNPLKALWFSIATAALQRPPLPEGIAESGRWLYLFESVLGPIQIALLALALRMRLRR